MPANETITSTALQQYLNRMDVALARLSESERREILLETQSHVAEQSRRAPMTSVPEILTELGEPEEYARTFLVDPDANTQRRPGALYAIAQLATGSWKALPLLFFVLSCYSIAVLMVFVAVLEITEPATTGFWIEHTSTGRNIGLTLSGPLTPERGPDALGWWLIPIAIGIAVMIHLAMSALLRRVKR